MDSSINNYEGSLRIDVTTDNLVPVAGANILVSFSGDPDSPVSQEVLMLMGKVVYLNLPHLPYLIVSRLLLYSLILNILLKLRLPDLFLIWHLVSKFFLMRSLFFRLFLNVILLILLILKLSPFLLILFMAIILQKLLKVKLNRLMHPVRLY